MPTTELKPSGITREGFAYYLEANGYEAKLHDGTRVRFKGAAVVKRVVIEQENHLKDGAILWGGKVDIYFNDFQVYSFGFGKFGMSLLTRIGAVIYKLEGLPVEWQNRDSILTSLEKRQVWYLQQAGEILEFNGQTGKVKIQAEDERGFNLPPWSGDGEQFTNRPWVDILSGEIHWRR